MAPLRERELVGLHPLSREIPNIDAAVAEIARFSAELTLLQGAITLHGWGLGQEDPGVGPTAANSGKSTR